MRGAHARPSHLANRDCLNPSPAPVTGSKDCRSTNHRHLPPCPRELQDHAAAGYRYRNIQDTDRING
jgi:hypothetical protein